MNKIYLHGDTHGGYHAVNIETKRFKEQKDLTKDDVLIILGDFGYFWNEGDQTSRNENYKIEVLASRRFQTCFIDGNHENFDILEGLEQGEKWGGKVGIWKSHSDNVIYYLKRGEIYTINDKRILTVGGAYSIDKSYRKTGISWWPQENINNAEIKNTLDNLDAHDWRVDIVLTHTCPSHIVKQMIREKPIDDNNTKFFDQLIKQGLKFDEWHFGHFHENRKIEHKFWCHFNDTPYLLT